jgi:hypothetical protein
MKRATLTFLAVMAASGCTGTKPEVTEDFSDLAGGDEKSDKFRSKFQLVGSLDYGQTSDSIKYANPPKYRAFKFGGQKGDVVEIDVTSRNGDAVAFLLDNAYNIVAQNDDANSDTLNSHIKATLPGNTNPDIITYYIAFRDYDLHSATFKVALKGKKVAPDFYSCRVDADCVAIPEGGCCPHGSKVAVNTSSVDAYNKSVACTVTPRPLCPLFLVNDTRVAECNTGTGKCEMVEPADIKCGGFTTNPHACPDGWDCLSTSHIPDVPGSCAPADAPQKCGGIAGLACPAGQTCVDDPTDSCDPAKGGADCIGICQTKTCIQNVLCVMGSHFDRTACKCVPDTTTPTDSCGGCAAGTYCTYCWSGYACIPNGALC